MTKMNHITAECIYEKVTVYISYEGDSITYAELFDLIFAHLATLKSKLLANILKDIGWVNSNSDGRRVIKQGGVKVDGNRMTDEKFRYMRAVSG